MVDFKKALSLTLQFEGLYSNDPRDLGGETYCGVSRKHHPNWLGWAEIDKEKARTGATHLKEKVPSADSYVADFYHVNFWVPMKCDQMVAQGTANFVFDMAVNCGCNRAGRILQVALKKLKSDESLALDGVIGPKTIALANSIEPFSLLVYLVAERMKYYAALASAGQAWAIKGWTARSFSYFGVPQW